MTKKLKTPLFRAHRVFEGWLMQCRFMTSCTHRCVMILHTGLIRLVYSNHEYEQCDFVKNVAKFKHISGIGTKNSPLFSTLLKQDGILSPSSTGKVLRVGDAIQSYDILPTYVRHIPYNIIFFGTCTSF